MNFIQLIKLSARVRYTNLAQNGIHCFLKNDFYPAEPNNANIKCNLI